MLVGVASLPPSFPPNCLNICNSVYVFDMYLTDDGLLFVKALFRSRLQNASRWTTQIPGHFSTIGFWWILQHCLCFLGTNFSGPFGTFLFSCVTLCYIFTFLILNSFTSYYIVINFMFMISNKRNNKIGIYLIKIEIWSKSNQDLIKI